MNKPILIYDINSFPEEGILLPERMMDLFRQERVVFYDSSKGGKVPRVICMEDLKVVFHDVSKEEELKVLTGYKKKLK